MRSKASATFSLVAALVAAPLAAAPQLVEVRVIDSAGKPVGGIEVEIAGVEGDAFSARRATGEVGVASFELPSAEVTYRLLVENADYSRFEQTFDLRERGAGRGETVRLQLTLSPPDAHEHFNRGVGALQAGDRGTAESELARAVELDPAFARGWSALALVLLDNAEEDWLRQRQERGELDATTSLAVAAQEQRQRALDAARRAVELAPEDPSALRGHFEALWALGLRDDADAALDALLAHDSSPGLARTVFNVGATAANAGELERGRRRLKLALEMEPGLWQAHAALAELGIRAQELDDALAELDQALAIAPGERRLWQRKLELLRALGRGDDAAAVERRLAELDGNG